MPKRKPPKSQAATAEAAKAHKPKPTDGANRFGRECDARRAAATTTGTCTPAPSVTLARHASSTSAQVVGLDDAQQASDRRDDPPQRSPNAQMVEAGRTDADPSVMAVTAAATVADTATEQVHPHTDRTLTKLSHDETLHLKKHSSFRISCC